MKTSTVKSTVTTLGSDLLRMELVDFDDLSPFYGESLGRFAHEDSAAAFLEYISNEFRVATLYSIEELDYSRNHYDRRDRSPGIYSNSGLFGDEERYLMPRCTIAVSSHTYYIFDRLSLDEYVSCGDYRHTNILLGTECAECAVKDGEQRDRP